MTNMFDEIIQNLEQWSAEQNIIETAIESCKANIQSCALDEAEWYPDGNTGVDILRGRQLSEIQLRFETQSLVFKSANVSYNYFSTQIGLYVTDSTGFHHLGLEPIGTYRLIVGLDGEILDDVLELDDKLYETK